MASSRACAATISGVLFPKAPGVFGSAPAASIAATSSVSPLPQAMARGGPSS